MEISKVYPKSTCTTVMISDENTLNVSWTVICPRLQAFPANIYQTDKLLPMKLGVLNTNNSYKIIFQIFIYNIAVENFRNLTFILNTHSLTIFHFKEIKVYGYIMLLVTTETI